jgi:hypothetical protein
MKKTLFLILSGAIVIFSIICICSGPVINGIIPKSVVWRTENCQRWSDAYKDENDKDTKESYKKARNKCNREKAMYGLEYSSLIIDVICGFVCTILGLLHYFDIGKPFEKVTGIIGLATGIIGFVLTLVYVIYSGYIFTKDPYQTSSGSNPFIIKRDGDWAFAKFESGKGYKCLFYKDKDLYSTLAKYSDLGKKQYNYNKKKIQEYDNHNSDFYKCHGIVLNCLGHQYYTGGVGALITGCDYLYAEPESGIYNKYLFDRLITTIIFSCFIFVCDIGLAIFGFLLFKSNGSGI